MKETDIAWLAGILEGERYSYRRYVGGVDPLSYRILAIGT